MTLLARLRAWLSPPDPLDDGAELVESLQAEMEFRQDKLRRENALDRAFDRAHRDALVEDRAYSKRPTPITRKLRGIVK